MKVKVSLRKGRYIIKVVDQSLTKQPRRLKDQNGKSN